MILPICYAWGLSVACAVLEAGGTLVMTRRTVMDAELAEAYRTVPGKRDYYVCGAHRLQLQADGTGTLVSVTLSE